MLEVCEPIENPALYMSDSDNDDMMDEGKKVSDDEPEVTTSKATKGQSSRKKIDKVTLSNKVCRRNLDLTRGIPLC